ncbi:MAG: hypothetical protein A3E82_04250 [Gammaproteobacteria bacterium RIFCSPHIGHO2_12_FULL_38_11]|nr:MAG: hypothetical protein A3E82_04250 [Gammaproteobacteria bacterium RIFCSPHIGHO2_12_FULL_38_11]
MQFNEDGALRATPSKKINIKALNFQSSLTDTVAKGLNKEQIKKIARLKYNRCHALLLIF